MDPLAQVPAPTTQSPSVPTSGVQKARPVAPIQAVSPTGQIIQKARPVAPIQSTPTELMQAPPLPVTNGQVQVNKTQATVVNQPSTPSPPVPVNNVVYAAPVQAIPVNGTIAVAGTIDTKQVVKVAHPTSPTSAAPSSPKASVVKAQPVGPIGGKVVAPGALPSNVTVARPTSSITEESPTITTPTGEPVKTMMGSTDPGSVLGKVIPAEKWETDPRLIRIAPTLFMMERSLLVMGACFWSWMLGRLHWSIAWIIILMLLLSPAYDRALRNSYKRNKLKARLEVVNDRLETDFESVDWWNIWLSKWWVEYEPNLSKSLATTINNVLSTNKPGFVQSWFLSEFTLGTQAPNIVGVKTYPQVQVDDVCMLLFHIVFMPLDYEDLQAEQAHLRRKRLAARKDPNAVIGSAHDLKNSLMVLKCFFGVGKLRVPVPIELKDVGLEGQFIVRFKFGPTWPHIQVMNVWFPEEYGPPQLDFSLKPLKGLDVGDIPGLKGFINSLVETYSRKFLQYPGYTYTFSQGPDQTALQNLCAGVLRICIYQARGLPNVDTLQGVSDPYAEVKLGVTGAQKSVMVTRVIKDNLNPVFNETKFVLVPASVLTAEGISTGADNLVFEMHDWNERSSSVFLGQTKKMRIAEFIRSGKDGNLPEERKAEIRASWGGIDDDSPTWAQLQTKDGKSKRGEIQFDLQWAVAAPLTPDNANVPSGIYRITIHQCADLTPLSGMADFSPYVMALVGGVEVFRTPIRKSTVNPMFGTTFEVYFNDVSRGKVALQVKHKDSVKKDPIVGELVLNASQSLTRKAGDDWYKLYNCSTGRIRLAVEFLPVQWSTQNKFAQGEEVATAQGVASPEDSKQAKKAAVAEVSDVVESAELAEFGLVWVGSSHGDIPPQAIEAGSDGVKVFSPLYIARVNTGSAVLTGKVGGALTGCNYGLNGKEYTSKDYEVLCANSPEAAKRLKWVPVTSMNQSFAHRLVSADCVDAVGNRLVIARVHFRNGTHIGYAGTELAGCNFGWGGKGRVETTNWEVLTVDTTAKPTAIASTAPVTVMAPTEARVVQHSETLRYDASTLPRK